MPPNPFRRQLVIPPLPRRNIALPPPLSPKRQPVLNRKAVGVTAAVSVVLLAGVVAWAAKHPGSRARAKVAPVPVVTVVPTGERFMPSGRCAP